jgi:hypothetical protein
VAAVLVLLPPLISCFSTTLNLTKPELHKQKFRLPDNPSFIECRVKITLNEKMGNNRDLTLVGEAYFQVQKENIQRTD